MGPSDFEALGAIEFVDWRQPSFFRVFIRSWRIYALVAVAFLIAGQAWLLQRSSRLDALTPTLFALGMAAIVVAVIAISARKGEAVARLRLAGVHGGHVLSVDVSGAATPSENSHRACLEVFNR